MLAELERRGRLYRVQRYKHSYPHCWRCSHELIFNAVQEWFIKADAGANPARERLRTAAKTVEWIPDYAGKRMDDWLQNMGDWCISRKRFWGLPLPFYIDHETGEVEVIGSRAELRERAVDPAMVDALPELHRPWIDEIQIRSRDGKRVLERVPEVGDAWLDAGIVPFATFGYNGATDLRMPELALNDETLIWDESKPSHIEEMTRSIRNTKFSTDIESRNFDVEIEQLLGDLRPFRQMNWQPVDFITEMREQVRLWFFSMLFMSVALEDRAPYKTAMVYETMLDQDGERISKTKKNGVPYDEAVETVGADPMRWTFCSNPLNKDIRFGYAPIHESARKLLTLWNVYGFFVNYANLDKPVLNSQFLVLNSDEQLKTQNSKLKTENILDRWILARLQNLIADVTSAIETVRPSDVTRNVESFVDDLSNWYVRRSRRRFWKSEGDEDKLAAYQTLHRVLVTVAQLVAPVIPFTAETMYQNLKTVSDNAPQSVHLCAWPQVEETLKNDELVREVEGVLQCVSLGHKARKKSKIKVRQPLERLLIKMPTQEAQISAIRNWKDSILDELNVEHLEFVDSLDVKYKLRANLPKLGAKYGKKVSAIRHYLENASAEVAKEIGVKTRLGESVHITVNEENVELLPDEILITTEEQEGLAFVSEGDWAVALDMILTEPLIVKGLARDFIRAIQQARKDAGFEISDRIAILLVQPQDESRLPDVLEDFGDLIQTETLADELRFVDADYPELIDAKMGEETIRLRVEKMPGGELAF